MKIAEKQKQLPGQPAKKKGVALVTVLTVMSLATLMVLTFFSLATSEQTASNIYSHGLQANQVAEQAVNIVIAQIREATSGSGAGDIKAWASQPGAIRVWDQSGQLEHYYKLYSSDKMKTTENTSAQEDFNEMQNWSSRKAVYVDLNEPVIRGEKVYYPIVNPAAADIPEWPKAIGKELDKNGIEGFAYNERGGNRLTDTGGAQFDAAAASAGSSHGHLAMPARWLYQLADGTLGVVNGGADAASYRFEAISGNGTPSVKNPMVARFAFWADDETSKLNLNTHAGGLAWDTPRAGGELDMNMGRYQPAQHEWQRYPGHPASTHLSPALAPGVLDIVNDRDAMEMLYRVVPRIVGGGSESGTREINTRNPKEANGLIADVEPLFPSQDDMIMRADREPHEFPDSVGRAIPADELSEHLERTKFFLTVSSRAPEVNLFGKPRIAIWPIYDADHSSPDYLTHLSAFDRLIHYCSSMGQATGSYPRHEYIFKRKNADSPTYDYSSIERNEELYQYLSRMLKDSIPGYGQSMASKYPGNQADSIITQIFDYIRTTNLHDDTLFGEQFNEAFTRDNTAVHRTYTNPRKETDKAAAHKGHGQVVPITIPGSGGGSATRGQGRFYTLSGVSVHLISSGEVGDHGYPAHMGATSYRNARNVDINTSERVYLNFPPMPLGVPPMPADWADKTRAPLDANWPRWMEALRQRAIVTGNPRLFTDAFDPSKWNWQLAYLDSNYAAHLAGTLDRNPSMDPSDYKYKRGSLSLADWTAGATRLYSPLDVPGSVMAGELTGVPDPAAIRTDSSAEAEQLVQGALFFRLFSPSVGWNGISPDMEIKISVGGNQELVFETPNSGIGMGEAGAGLDGNSSRGYVPFMGFDMNPNPGEWIFATNASDAAWDSRRYGGLQSGEFLVTAPGGMWDSANRRTLYNQIYAASGTNIPQWPSGGTTFPHSTAGGVGRMSYLDRGYTRLPDLLDLMDVDDADDVAQSYRYDLVTVPFKIRGAKPDTQNTTYNAFNQWTSGDVEFKGGTLTFEFYHGGKHTQGSAAQVSGGVDDGELLQTIEVEIEDFSNDAYQETADVYKKAPRAYLAVDSVAGTGGTGPVLTPVIEMETDMRAIFNEFNKLERDSFGVMDRISMTLDPANPLSAEKTRVNFHNYNTDKARWHVKSSGRFGQISVHGRPGLIGMGDMVQATDIVHGDPRSVMAQSEVRGNTTFKPHRNYSSTSNGANAHPMAHSLTSGAGGPNRGSKIHQDYYIRYDLQGTRGHAPYRGRVPLPLSVEKSETVQRYGDFDNGAGLMVDGPYINKPDEGNVNSLGTRYQQELAADWESERQYGAFPYFAREWRAEAGGPAYFSPNRMVPGPGMFGSLPVGNIEDEGWRTLLFRPNSSSAKAGYHNHPGAVNPPDHLFLDLFWMPIVEPYAISEPLSTAGKVNMNFQIVPYLHIDRSTALRGVFRSEFMLCVPNMWNADYKHDFGRGQGYHWRDAPYAGQLQGKRLRSAIVEVDTIEQFYETFGNGEDIFKSASQICDIHLIPEEVSTRLGLGRQGTIQSYTPTLEQMENGQYWQDHALIGDNAKERPYTNIHNRLTTKSNTFQVHYRAQVLKQSRRENDGEYAEWRPEVDSVMAEYRGSSIVERYVDPNDPDIPDFATAAYNETLDPYYRFRVVNPKRFAP